MKEKWIEPKVLVQKFVANEYVSACVVGTVQCIYPNDPEIYDSWHMGQRKYKEERTGYEHGICGNVAYVTFNESTGSGYEANAQGVPYPNRVISIPPCDYPVKEGYYLQWTSKDNDDPLKLVYTHYGRLKVQYTDKDCPNHS
jgi:hypothetical protein